MTLIELLVFVSAFLVGTMTFSVARFYFNIWAGFSAAFLALVVFFKIMDFLNRFGRRRHRRKMAEKYPRIFRVLAVPVERDSSRLLSKLFPAENHVVKIGDYGWEANPFLRRATDRKGNLIYLKGWNEDWKLIWYAGFRPNEIEFVGPKPFSEYDLPNRPAPRPVCPFPVQPRDTTATPPPAQFAN